MLFTKIAINRPVTTLMLSIALIFLGLLSYKELQVQKFPDVSFPFLYYGAVVREGEPSPEATNDLLTRPFEKMVASLKGVEEMKSRTYEGRFWGYAKFARNTDMRFRVIELQDKIDKWLGEKEEKIDFWVVPQSTDSFQNYLMDLTLSVPTGKEFQVSNCTDLIKRKLKSIDGISEVEVSGEVFPNMTLETDNDSLRAKGLSVQELLDAVNNRSVDKKWLGSLDGSGKSHDVYFHSEIKTLDELLSIPVDDEGIYSVGGVVVPVSELKKGENIFRINGKKAVRVRVQKEKERNTIQMAHLVRERLKEIKKDLPEGFDILIRRDEAKDLEKLIFNLAKLASAGGLLAMLVLLLFVRNWRISAVVAIAIPTSIIITFNAMYGGGVTINILSLLGLAAGVGMLVDNSIVVVENVFRHSQKTKTNKQAALEGSKEVARAILISTTTTVVVFIPLVFFDDTLAIIMKAMALSFIAPLVISLLVALTLVPMLTSKVIGSHKWKEKKNKILSVDSIWVRWNPWQKPNRKPRRIFHEFIFFCAKSSIRHPIRLFFAVLSILLITFFAASIKIYVQGYSGDRKTEVVTLYGKPPLGSTLEEADEFFRKKEQQIEEFKQKGDVITSFSSRFDKNSGRIEIEINEKYQHLELESFKYYFTSFFEGDQNKGFRFHSFPSARVFDTSQITSDLGYSHGRDGVVVSGDNYEAMLEACNLLIDHVKKNKDVGEATFNPPIGNAEVFFEPSIELVKTMKVDLSSLQTFFRSRENKGISTSLTLKENDIEKRVAIKVLPVEKEEDEEEVKQTLRELKKTKVPLMDGGTALLEDLGTFSIHHSIPYIEKHDRLRNLSFQFSFPRTFYYPGMAKQRHDALVKISDSLKEVRLPSGISAQMSGSLQESGSQKVTWKKIFWLAVLTIYLVMAFFFGSLTSPFIILWTVPLAAVGGIWGVIIARGTLDEVAMLASIILVGLVVNNGILLVEYTQQMITNKGYRKERALLEAVAYRVRPILMTSLTTILGLLPILLSKEAAREARSLVSVLVGGIIFSALLTLVVVPVLFNVFSIWRENLEKAKNKISRKVHKKEIGTTSDLGLSPKQEFSEELRISIENVSKIYSVFKMKKLLHFIPSRDYSYGCRPIWGTRALNRVSLEIDKGMFGLLGPNGAGKTTLMKIITGLVSPTFGTVTVNGMELRNDPHSVRDLISYLPQNFGVYESLTLTQYLNFFAAYYGLDNQEERKLKIQEVIEKVGLDGNQDRAMKQFSGGMKQRAGIAQFLLGPKPIIIVDEPTAGLDPVERVRFRLLLSKLARDRIVILSTHIVDDITSSCKRVAVLNRGNIIYEGDLEEIQKQAQGLIWDVSFPEGVVPEISNRNILFKKHVNGQIVYHYVSRSPLPGSIPVEPNFEDAYVALMVCHDEECDIKSGN